MNSANLAGTPEGMEKVQFTVWGKPTVSDLRAIKAGAKLEWELGGITAIPTDIKVESTAFGLYRIILTVTRQDRPYWLGFARCVHLMWSRPNLVGAKKFD